MRVGVVRYVKSSTQKGRRGRRVTRKRKREGKMNASAKRYRDLIARIGLNQTTAAELLKVDVRTSRRYACGEYEVPYARWELLIAELKRVEANERRRVK